MPSPVTESFMRTLQDAEKSRDATRLAELFGDDAELSSVTRHGPRRGKIGARQFWADYLHSFGKVRSQFGKVTEADGTAVLEWESEVTLPDGRLVKCRGASILVTAGDRVRRVRMYYDTAALRPAAAATTPGGRTKPPSTPDDWGPDAVKPTPARDATTSVEQINRETQPRTPEGHVVDPKPEEVRDTAG